MFDGGIVADAIGGEDAVEVWQEFAVVADVAAKDIGQAPARFL